MLNIFRSVFMNFSRNKENASIKSGSRYSWKETELIQQWATWWIIQRESMGRCFCWIMRRLRTPMLWKGGARVFHEDNLPLAPLAVFHLKITNSSNEAWTEYEEGASLGEMLRDSKYRYSEVLFRQSENWIPGCSFGQDCSRILDGAPKVPSYAV